VIEELSMSMRMSHVPLLFCFALSAACATIGTEKSEAASLAACGELPPGNSEVSRAGSECGPATERAVGYLALAAGAAAVYVLAVGFYKLGKLLAH